MKILSARQMKALDQYTIENKPVSSLDLMERAATAVCDAMEQYFAAEQPKLVVLCGPGNNGGDGLAVSRIMAGRGYAVECYLFNISGRLSGDCQANLERMTPEVEMHEVKSRFTFPHLEPDCVIVDALFGTGLSRPLDGGFASLIQAINATGCRVVSIDTPSGLMCEDNRYNNRQFIVQATLTLTFHRPKLAHLFAENETFVGRLEVLDIGLMTQCEEEQESNYYLTEKSEMQALRRHLPRFAHKGTAGHAMLLAGCRGMAGAAILAARACLRTGAGKVTVSTAQASIVPLQVAVPEAVVTIATGPVDHDVAGRYNAVGMGPGMGTADLGAPALNLLRHADCPTVFDADALNLLSLHPEWMNQLPQDSILTPHPKELERIVGRCQDSLDRMNKALALAVRHHIYVLVKGHYSMVCTPHGKVYFNTTGNPGMATAGSGDVLTGMITSLLAQGYAPFDALRLGVWLHGTAGDMALHDLGCEEAVTASDIITHIGKAFASLSL